MPRSEFPSHPASLRARFESLVQRCRDEANSVTDDRLMNGGRAHNTLNPAAPFVKRNPALNDLPVFYAKFETEIANSKAVKDLPDQARHAYLIRLIGKRFIDNETGLSYLAGSGVGKGNPPLKTQNKAVREIRVEAASQTIESYSGAYLKAAWAHIVRELQPALDELPAGETIKVALVRPGRSEYSDDCTVNFLSLAANGHAKDTFESLEAARCGALGRSPQLIFDDSRLGLVISRTARSNASPVGRLVQQGAYDLQHFQAGEYAVITDDHTQAGATLLSLGSSLTERGVKVLAAVTPTVHPYCQSLRMSDWMREALDDVLGKWDPEGIVSRKLEELGLPVATMTNPEALILLAYATDPNDARQMRRFDEVESRLRQYEAVENGQVVLRTASVMEGESDSLQPILECRPLPAKAIVAEMEREAGSNRKVIMPERIEQIHVLDWDDFLRDEKRMNYKLFHNAIAQAADALGHDEEIQSCLKSLDGAMRRVCGNFKSGMPEVCRSEEGYQAFALSNHDFTKRKMTSDLLDKIGAVEPSLGSRLAAQPSLRRKIENILNAQFHRNYKKLISDGLRRQLNPAKRETEPRPSQAQLPYPSIKLELMPGARAFLDEVRKPGNRVMLISNRPLGDLEKEINLLGLAHYFDGIFGPEVITHLGETPPYGRQHAEIQKSPGKPDPHMLATALSAIPGASGARINLWGDRITDITQARSFQNWPGGISATLVTPYPPENPDAGGIPFRVRKSLERPAE